METTIEKKTAAHVIMLWKYKPRSKWCSLTRSWSGHQTGECGRKAGRGKRDER
jgi:hypothetical protein